MKVLVIPSNREDQLRQFLQEWHGKGGWDKIIVVQDEPTYTFPFPRIDVEMAWDTLPEPNWIFSRRDSAIRCAGFYEAWKMGAEYVLTLDDDCYPMEGTTNFFDEHIAAMWHPCCIESVPKQRTRGLPYRDLGEMQSDVNIGLWTHNLDLDSVQSLSGENPPDPSSGSRLIARSQYAPMCGMNLCFRADAIPLMYFPLMGEGQPYRRFDDIWCGIICKKVMDHLGWSMSVGDPYVKHIRASDPFKNLVAEAPGIARNETFWQDIDRLTLTKVLPAECMNELGEQLENQAEPYMYQLGRALQAWSNLFLS